MPDWSTDWITLGTVVAGYGLIATRIGRVEKRQRDHTDDVKRDLGERLDRMEARLVQMEARLLDAIREQVRA